MALAVDDTTVPRFSGVVGDNVDIVSATFTPPDGAALVVCVNADASSASGITVAVSGGGLVWTNRAERDKGDAGALDGHASIWTAPVSTGASMSVAVRRTTADAATDRLSAKVYIVTGHDAASPVGQVGKGSSTTNSINAPAYTSSVAGSRAFGCATEWQQRGLPVSTDTEDAADYAGAISVLSVYKAADTGVSGTAVTLNFDAAGTSAAAWNWVAIEIKPAAGGTVAVGRDLALSWTIRNAAARDLVTPWTLRASAGRDLTVPWLLRASAGRDLTTPWLLRASAGRDFTVPWLVRAAIARDLVLAWQIAGGGGVVTVGRDLVLPWTMRALAGRQLESPWLIRSRGGRDVQLLWTLTSTVGRDLELPWGVRARTGRELELAWAVNATAGRDVVVVWRIGGELVVLGTAPAGRVLGGHPGRVVGAARAGRARAGSAGRVRRKGTSL